jgi:type II secretory pathway pseudopilin PulG
MIKKNRIGQVWIETVLYTLIGLALIGMVLAFTLPKITKTQERILVEQSLSSIKLLDQIINSVIENGPDNVRIYEINFKEGNLFIDSQKDIIYFQIDEMKDYYSQPDVTIDDGNVKILSFGKKGSSSIKIALNYTRYADITFDGKNVEQRITKSSTPYKLIIRNLGSLNQDSSNIDIRLG